MTATWIIVRGGGCVEIGLCVWRERWVCGVCVARLCVYVYTGRDERVRKREWVSGGMCVDMGLLCRDGVVVWRE